MKPGVMSKVNVKVAAGDGEGVRFKETNDEIEIIGWA